MEKIYKAMGLMSGTSLDGIDVSIIETDGNKQYSSILNSYFEYDKELIQKLDEIRKKILNFEGLERYFEELKHLEREVTLAHFKAVNDTIKRSKSEIDIIGFHGQTIFHDSKKKITKQLGDGNLLSQLTKKKVVYNFRQNDLENGGEGAPLVPIFHNAVANEIYKEFKLEFPINIINIGGISNVTTTTNWKNLWLKNKIYAFDVGPGNCLIDEWIRRNSKEYFDKEGLIARSGKTDKLILNQAFENYSSCTSYENSLDIKDFDIFFAKGLSLENGAATVTELTAKLITDGISYVHSKIESKNYNWLVCGGGRKNKFLMEKVKDNFENINLRLIDDYNIDGDFIESQAFAYLAVRSLKGMPISFPSTTRCKEEITGGVIAENF